MSSLWVGIDVGTQSVKATVVGMDGRERGSGSAPLTSRRTADTHEQDPIQWVQQAILAVALAIDGVSAGERKRIAGVAICATSGTITTVDQKGRPLSAGLMYDDARAVSLTPEVAEADPNLWKRLGYRIQPTWALPKVLWLARDGALDHRAKVATQADVVAAAVTGGPVPSDWSHSLKSGYDLINLEWPSLALRSLHLDEDVFPEVVAPGSFLGTSSAAWEESTALPKGTPVFAGMTDGCAAQLSSGTLVLGDWHTVIGTTLVTKTVSDRIVVDASGALYSHRSPATDTWFPGGASNVGAGILRTIFADDDLTVRTAGVAEAFDRRLADIPLCYPLNGLGERFPFSRPDAEGFIRVDDEPMAITRAAGILSGSQLLASLFLGIACVERLAVDTITEAGVAVNGRFTSSGGATRNDWLNQLRADLLGRDISIPASAQGSLGMAILAAWGSAHQSNERDELSEIAERMSPLAQTIETNLERHYELDPIYARFRSELESRGWLPT